MREQGCKDSREQIVRFGRARQCRHFATGCSSIHWRTRRESVGEAVTSKRRNCDLDARRGASAQSTARVVSAVEDRRSVESPSARHRRERMHLRPASLRVSCSLRRRMGRIAAQFIETIYLVWPHRTLDPGSSRAHEQQLVDPHARWKKLETASSPFLRRCRGAHLSSGNRWQRPLGDRALAVVPTCNLATGALNKDPRPRKAPILCFDRCFISGCKTNRANSSRRTNSLIGRDQSARLRLREATRVAQAFANDLDCFLVR